MRALLASGGFNMRQWCSNIPEVFSHLPLEAKSTECELRLTPTKDAPQESTLGLLWRCRSDTLGYKPRTIRATEPTMRYVYRVLASQYDPLGYIIPYTTRAKVLVQALWRKERGWDEPILEHSGSFVDVKLSRSIIIAAPSATNGAASLPFPRWPTCQLHGCASTNHCTGQRE